MDESLDTLGSNIHRFPFSTVTSDDYDTDFTHLKWSVCQRHYMDFCASYARLFNVEVQPLEESDMRSPPISRSVQSKSGGGCLLNRSRQLVYLSRPLALLLVGLPTLVVVSDPG